MYEYKIYGRKLKNLLFDLSRGDKHYLCKIFTDAQNFDFIN